MMIQLSVRTCLGGLLLAAVGCGGSGDGPAGPEGSVNQPPLIFSFPQVADHDLEYRAQIPVSDPEGGAVTVRVRQLPPWLTFDVDAGELFGTPGEAALGTSPTIRVEARDEEGALGVRSVPLTVRVGTSRLDSRGPWQGWTPHVLYHDGAPVESDHFVVHSGYSSQTARTRLSGFLETQYRMLLERLGADPADADFPPGGRLHVFSDKLQADAAFGATSTTNGWAFPDGLLVMAEDAPRFQRQGYTTARWEGLVTHELMHDVEFLLNGRHVPVTASDVWFREGIATYMAGLAPGGIPLSSLGTSALNSWRQQMASVPGGGNPVGVHLWADFPATVLAQGSTGSYYAWFAMTVMYLAHDDGLGLGDAGLRGFYEDQRRGVSFAESFRSRTGLSLEQFEQEWWTRMQGFVR